MRVNLEKPLQCHEEDLAIGKPPSAISTVQLAWPWATCELCMTVWEPGKAPQCREEAPAITKALGEKHSELA